MMKRIYSCMHGHVPRVEISQQTGNVLLVCPHESCGEATHLHKTVGEAITEWNNSGSACWRNYEVKWWHWFLRWWRGCFYE